MQHLLTNISSCRCNWCGIPEGVQGLHREPIDNVAVKLEEDENYSCQVDENNAQNGAVVLHNLGTVSWDPGTKEHRAANTWGGLIFGSELFLFCLCSLLFIPRATTWSRFWLAMMPCWAHFCGLCATEKLLIIGFAILLYIRKLNQEAQKIVGIKKSILDETATLWFLLAAVGQWLH